MRPSRAICGYNKEIERITSKDNPALRFISAAPAEEPAERPDPEAPPARPEDGPGEGYRANSLYVEKKTRRLQLVLRPSLYAQAKRQAQGISLNEYVCRALERASGKE